MFGVLLRRIAGGCPSPDAACRRFCCVPVTRAGLRPCGRRRYAVLKPRYDAGGGGLRNFAVRGERERARADGEPFDGEDAFVERELREDFEHLRLHFGQCRAPLRRGDACSGAEQVQRHVIGRPSVSTPFDGVQFRGCQPCRGVIPHGVAHVALRPGVEGVTPLCRELFRRTLEVGAIHC